MKLFFAFLVSFFVLFCFHAEASSNVSFSIRDTSTTVNPDSLSLVKPTDSLGLVLYYRDSLVNELISYAKTFIGCPYRYAGKTRAGFDCSGYVSTMFAHIGVTLSPSSVGMAGSGRVVPDSTIQAGDILFFINTQRKRSGIGHVGFVIEVKDGQVLFLHSACNGGVKYEYLSHPYYKAHYYRAERIKLFDVN
ncbi:Murein DD-endopeptidase MepS/Murein LD-carboxypeptidase [bioreactor metagenome]|uniref:Murein DD-endopeptidase MepS/Murein LD-carboxypeptidase n=1 Tax=bioreactor metagenome TaxID=1076179 RepID=A0A644X3D7_9ZZZZ